MDEDLVPISALQHLVFCERQAALIHVGRIWRDDHATAQGRVVHERMDKAGSDQRRGVRILRAVHLGSACRGLIGKADMVELHADRAASTGWRPVPIEVKKGRRSERLADRVQLCAQAFCLEEMMNVEVPEGAIFYAATHKRVRVVIDAALRARTEAAIARMREILISNELPPPELAPKCRQCSLEPDCMPQVDRARARRYCRALTQEP